MPRGRPFPTTLATKSTSTRAYGRCTTERGGYVAPGATLADGVLSQLTLARSHIIGRWLELQYFLLRYSFQEGPASARKECSEEATDTTTSRCHQDPRYGRGTMAARPATFRIKADSRHADRLIYLHRHRAPGSSEMACAEEEFESRDDQMGATRHCSTDAILALNMLKINMLTRNSERSDSSMAKRRRYTGVSKWARYTRQRAGSGSWVASKS